MGRTFRILEVSSGRPQWDVEFSFNFNGDSFEVKRYGTNFSVPTMQTLIKDHRSKVDAFALSGIPSLIRFDQISFLHKDYFKVMSTPSNVSLCDGSLLRAMGNIQSLHNLIQKKKIQPEKGVYFPTAIMNMEIINYLEKNFPESIYIGDFTSMISFPFLVKNNFAFKELAKIGLNLSNLKSLKDMAPGEDSLIKAMARESIRPQLEHIKYFFSELGYLNLEEGQGRMIEGKELIIFSHHSEMQNNISKYNPQKITNLFPERYQLADYMNYSILDAAFRLSFGTKEPLNVDQISELFSVDTEIKQLFLRNTYKRKDSFGLKLLNYKTKFDEIFKKTKKPDFAFVVHALSKHDLIKAPGLGFIKYTPLKFQDQVERSVSHLPGIVYGEVKNIVSPITGKEVTGRIYALWSTPKMLKETAPEITYKKIESLCQHASAAGAKIIGLGAYTKIVGDNGYTINRNSPIPVTTGNSLSAVASVWSLYELVDRMGLTPRKDGIYQGTAMVIGASGSIGRVSAKLMSEKFASLILIAPRLEKLKEIEAEIKHISPNCKVLISTDANSMASEADAILTATSSIHEKVVDLMQVKAGAVISDCSRPLEFTLDDVKCRPDIIVIESGEIALPGPVDVSCDLGLEDNLVYACLAETALLALEEKYESFTLGKELDFAKTKTIFELAQKHGLVLSPLRGHLGELSEKEIALAREKALKLRKGK